MNIAADTDIGNVRENNEDAYWYDSALQAMAVADGMGGHNGGEVASHLAAHGFGMLYRAMAEKIDSEHQLQHCLHAIETRLDQLVHEASQTSQSLAGMGTTLVGAVCRDNQLHLVHTGDSRAAFVSPTGQVRWLTRDDNYAQRLVDQGRFTEDQARTSSYRHQITAYVGQGRQPERGEGNHYQVLYWPEDHLLLLCTDGLLDDTQDREIGHLAAADSGTLAIRCRRLTELANNKGGRDNCTVLLAARDE